MNFLKPNIKKIIIFLGLYIIIHLPLLVYLISFGDDLSIIAVILHTSRIFLHGLKINFLDILPWASPVLFAIFLYVVSCWTVRGFSRAMLQGKSRLAKTIIISSVILPFVLIGFLGRNIFYFGSISIVKISSDKAYDMMLEFAKDTQNVFLCNFAAENRRGSCRSYIAKTKADDFLCGEIKDNYTRDFCHYLTGDCNKIEYDRHSEDSCYLKMAKDEKDASICDRNWRYSSKRECLMDVALETGDISVCRNKPMPSKDNCISDIIIRKQSFDPSASDFEICKTLRSGKDACILSVAMATENTDLCQEISNYDSGPASRNQYRRDDCYYTFAIYSEKYKDDFSLCSKIEEWDYLKDRCFDEIAIETNNYSLCANIQSEDKSNSCYREIAAEKKDTKICDYIQDESSKKGCYSRAKIYRR